MTYNSILDPGFEQLCKHCAHFRWEEGRELYWRCNYDARTIQIIFSTTDAAYFDAHTCANYTEKLVKAVERLLEEEPCEDQSKKV